MDLQKYNPKKPPTSEHTKQVFLVNKFQDVILPLIQKKIEKDKHLLEQNNSSNIEKHSINDLSKDQIKAIIDIYFRDMAAYLHTPCAPRYSTPIGSFNVRYGAIDSYIRRKGLPNLKQAKQSNNVEDIEKATKKFQYLWKLRNTKRAKVKSSIGLSNKDLQLSAKDQVVLKIKETNPIQLVVIDIIKKLIKKDDAV